MGEGADAGIAIHKDLRVYPRSLDEVRADGPIDAEAAPAVSQALFENAIAHHGHAAGPRVPTEDADAGTTPADDD
jgi:thioredoxin reductase (NADPH)